MLLKNKTACHILCRICSQYTWCTRLPEVFW